jgi:hypothetical protein
MIYGINFNNTQIPDHIRGLFSADRRFSRGWFTLQGVCNTVDEAELMEMQADNGHRTIQVVGPRIRMGTMWWGVYYR